MLPLVTVVAVVAPVERTGSLEVRRKEAVAQRLRLKVRDAVRPTRKLRAHISRALVKHQACQRHLIGNLGHLRYAVATLHKLVHVVVLQRGLRLSQGMNGAVGHLERHMGACMLPDTLFVAGIGRRHGPVAARGVDLGTTPHARRHEDLTGVVVDALHVDREGARAHLLGSHLLRHVQDELGDVGPVVGALGNRAIAQHDVSPRRHGLLVAQPLS